MLDGSPLPGRDDLATTWTLDFGSYTAVLENLAFRIVAYPHGSPLAGKYGCYCKADFIGLAANLSAAKVVCGAHAGDSKVLPA
ncbi:MAG TPA: hypothetical protein VJ890_04445 [Vineibacter sp.]|nr:hypothetical protein [Vineibacter sp.]